MNLIVTGTVTRSLTLSLTLLPRAVLAAVQIPYAAAGLDALSRELPVQPLRIAFEYTKVLGVNRKVTTGDCTKRTIDERGKVNRPTLTL